MGSANVVRVINASITKLIDFIRLTFSSLTVPRCLGDQCAQDLDCSVNIANSVCSGGTCQCAAGFSPNVCGQCVPGKYDELKHNTHQALPLESFVQVNRLELHLSEVSQDDLMSQNLYQMCRKGFLYYFRIKNCRE